MHRTAKILMGLTVVALLVMPSTSSFAQFSKTIQGGVLDVPNVAPFNGSVFPQCARHRLWTNNSCNTGGNISPICPTAGGGLCTGTQKIADCVGGSATCGTCARGYTTNSFGSLRGGYQSGTDNIANFCGGAVNDLPMYSLWEVIDGAGTGAYVSYYALQGQVANGTLAALRNAGNDDCSGAINTNCFFPGATRIDRHAAPQQDTRVDNDVVAPQNQLANKGGISPFPAPRVAAGTTQTNVNLNWDAAFYLGNGSQGSAASPIQGYRVYRCNTVGCAAPSEADVCWQPIGNTSGTTFNDPVPGGGDCSYYALRLVLSGPPGVANGPNASPGELVSHYLSASSQAVARNGSVVVISNFNVAYIGKNTIRATWQSGSESEAAGYWLNRGTSAAGPFSHVGTMIVPTGDNSTYSVDDRVTRKEGTTFIYQLEVVKKDGTSQIAGSDSANLPGAVRK